VDSHPATATRSTTLCQRILAFERRPWTPAWIILWLYSGRCGTLRLHSLRARDCAAFNQGFNRGSPPLDPCASCAIKPLEPSSNDRSTPPGTLWSPPQGEGELQGEWKPPPAAVLATRRILKAKRPARGGAADTPPAPSPFGGVSLTAPAANPAAAANPFAAVSLTAPTATPAPTNGSPAASSAKAAEPSPPKATEPSPPKAAEPSPTKATEPSPTKAASPSPAKAAASNASPAATTATTAAAAAAAAPAAASFAVPSTSAFVQNPFGQKHHDAAASSAASLTALASSTPTPFVAGSMWTGGGFGSLSGTRGFGSTGAGFGAPAAAASTSPVAGSASTAVRFTAQAEDCVEEKRR
jgi:hypothetical protein